MGLIVKDTGGDFEPIPAGVHIAVCMIVADLGIQDGNGPYKARHQIFVQWEIPGLTYEARLEDGSTEERPRNIFKTYTASLGERANLRHDLEAWRGRPFTERELEGFDLANILGAPVQLAIAVENKNGRPRNKIMGIMGLPPGMPRPPKPTNTILYSDENPQTFDLLPGWIQQKIRPTSQQPTQQWGQQPGSPFSAPPPDDFGPPPENYFQAPAGVQSPGGAAAPRTPGLRPQQTYQPEALDDVMDDDIPF